jgi:hypothetical protein
MFSMDNSFEKNPANGGGTMAVQDIQISRAVYRALIAKSV